MYLIRPRVREVDVVGGDHHGGAGVMQLLRELHELQGHLRIETGGGLVHHENLRLHGYRTGNREPLPLAVGELHGVPVPHAGHADQGQGALHPRFDLPLVQTEVAGPVDHIVPHGLPEDLVIRILKDHGDPGPQLPETFASVSDRLPVEEDAAGARPEQAVEMVEQCGFPGAVGPEDNGPDAPSYPYGHTVQGGAVVAGVPEGQILSLDDRISHRTTSGALPNAERLQMRSLTTSTSSGSQ